MGAFVYARAQADGPPRVRPARAAPAGGRDREALLLPQEDLTALPSFLEASDVVDAKQFRLLTNPMLVRNRVVYAFEWLPLVRDTDRAHYEAEARDAGLTGYRFWERGPTGKPRRGGPPRPVPPIHFMEPPSAFALGFDIAVGRVSLADGETARDTGDDRGVAPFDPGRGREPPDAQPVVAAYAPVFLEGDPGPRRRASRADGLRDARSSASRRSWTRPPPRWTPRAWASR